ncbi:MAG: tRNA-specific 2-thiouridylase MnmA [Chitinophagales bacterium]|nr:MAG: tRNA-specific 2-thiouridylase MnmA [Chitinophagales bacterium]
MKKKKVLVAMSGGIDSTVAAVLLNKQGYEVIGVTMKTWDYAHSGGTRKETGCCSLDSINDARQVAVDMGFPHYIIDIRSEFGEYVIDNFVEEYLAGRTPNPCILCNTHIKWEALLRRADALHCDYIATGHYARLRYENGRFVIARGLDRRKDQSYVLWGVSQQCLSRTIFPLADYDKTQIRKMAEDWGYTALARKPESYEICFVPDNDYRGFLKRKVKNLEENVRGGKFVNREGKVLGTHQGYPFYTIGQRRGLGVATGQPMYVTGIIPETNTVVLGNEDELKHRAMYVGNLNMIKYSNFTDGMELLTTVRYNDKGTMARVYNERDGKRVRVEFQKPVRAITPGQSAVFYEGDDVVGGGIIQQVFD